MYSMIYLLCYDNFFFSDFCNLFIQTFSSLDYLILAEQISSCLACAETQGLLVVFAFKSPFLTWPSHDNLKCGSEIIVLLAVINKYFIYN